MAYRFVACPACHLNSFDVKQDTESREILIECRACQAVLLRSAPPETLQSQASGGSTHAPVGGPHRS